MAGFRVTVPTICYWEKRGLLRAQSPGRRTPAEYRVDDLVRLRPLGEIFRNPLYKGHMIVESLGIEAQGDYEPLVSPEDFERAQKALSGRRRKRVISKREIPDFPLRRFVTATSAASP